MEGFEIIHKYNERCLQWRMELAHLIAKWAADETGPAPASPLFTKQCSALVGFLCAKGSETRQLLEAVHDARIEHVVLALRYLRDRASTKKPACNFCTEPGGKHVAACLGEVQQCSYVYDCSDGLSLRCDLPKGHAKEHICRAFTRTSAH